MENMKCHSNQNSHPPKTLRNFAIGVFVVGGGYYLWMQHRAHVLQYWPFALFLLCPLMHLFPGGCHSHIKHKKLKNHENLEEDFQD